MSSVNKTHDYVFKARRNIKSLIVPDFREIDAVFVDNNILARGLDYTVSKDNKLHFRLSIGPVNAPSKNYVKAIAQHLGIIKMDKRIPVICVRTSPKKTRFEIDFPHGSICYDCATKKGGFMPENACNTCSHDTCPYCGQGAGTYSISDFRWPAYKREAIWD